MELSVEEVDSLRDSGIFNSDRISLEAAASRNEIEGLHVPKWTSTASHALGWFIALIRKCGKEMERISADETALYHGTIQLWRSGTRHLEEG